VNETEDGERAPQTPHPNLSREPPSGLLERVRALFGLAPASARDDIEDALEESASEEFTPQERAILKNVLALHDVRVADVMVPRADVIAIGLDTPLREVLDLFRTAGHSRLPVYEDTLDDPRGMIHIRDFVVFLASDPRFGLVSGPLPAQQGSGAETGLDMPLSAARILRPVLYAPPSMPALDLLLKMQASRTHMALVIDEYGGTDGLVSIEDVVESIVGDIEDEHDEAETPELQPAGDGGFVVEARTPLGDVSTAVGFDFGTLADAEGVDTIGGLVTAAAGRVPGRGEILRGPGEFEFEVLDADPRRVKRLKIWPLAARGANPAAAPPSGAVQSPAADSGPQSYR
jgi:CBS domain containing-hemolysin-like protein